VRRKDILLILPSRNFQEDEYNIITKYLRKSGVRIFISSVKNGLSIGKLGLKVQTDVMLCNVNHKNFSGIVLVGGSGVLNEVNNEDLQMLIHKFKSSRKLVAAICAAPLILGNAGLLKGIDATCNNKFKDDLENLGARYIDAPVVQSGNILTSQSPHTAKEFAAAVVNLISK
jgi:4-methyl-5(b-hydroxyethyl)-thiazole monophosphate biosynthesis